jgi:2',3'-cyclic-nucleotide 2'-phosphodiesterase (5'-nucleotidase family)
VFAAHFVERRGMAIHPIIDAMNRMGYDVATPGNHEFNFGLDALWRMRRGARFPYVSANVAGAPGRHVLPAVTIERAGVRVAFTGVTTPGVMVWDADKVRGRMRVGDLTQAAPPALAALARAADVTVLLAHAGLDGPSSYQETADAPAENAIAAVLAAAPRTDLAVLGHTHRDIADTMIGTTLVVQPGAHARSLAVAELRLVREGDRWRVTGKRGALVRLDRVPPDSALATRFVAAHRTALRVAEAPVGSASAAMPGAHARLEDTPLVDFVNAVMRRASGAELSASAAFDTRAAIPAGPVRLRDLAAVYPYEANTLRAVKISGADLRAYLEHAARYYRGVGADGQPVVNDSVPGYNFDIVSGVDYELDVARPVGSRVVALRVRGRDVAATDSFTLALNDYRQQGGGGFPAVAAAPVVYRGDATIRDLLVAEFRRRGTVRPEDDFAPSWSIRSVPVNGAGGHGGTDSIVLRVLTTNDLHGRLTARPESWSNRRPVGGAAAIAGMMNRLEAECGCPTLRLDGGDLMQGTPVSNLSYGRATVDAANAMGYHAAAIGNHEFDWTVDTLAARIRQARFAWLSANIVTAGPGSTRAPRRRPAWATPWRMVQAGPLRVALIGFTSPGTTTSTNPRHVARLGFRGAAVVDSLVGVARAQRADYVIVIAHEGAFCDRDNACRGAVVNLAMDLAQRPDLIVSGHTHSLVTTWVNGIPIVQARSGGTALGIVDLPRPGSGRQARLRVETVWADRETPDTLVARVVAAHEAGVDSLVQRPVVVLAERLARDSGLGAMIAESNRRVAQADIGLVNATGVRRSLDAGPARWGDLFEVLPFGNYVMRLDIDGRTLRSLAQHVVARRDHFAGLTVTMDSSRPAGERITGLTLADGRAVSDTGRYTLGVLDFLANGGSGYAMLTDVPATNTGVTDLDAFIEYLRSLPQPVRAPRRAAP